MTPVAMMRQRGVSLLEVVVVLAIAGLFLTISSFAMQSVRRRTGLRAAAGGVRHLLMKANSSSVSRGSHCGVRFFNVGDQWFYTVYEDGNGNGIYSEEIKRGIDKLIEGPKPLFEPGSAQVGFPPSGIVDPDTNRPFPAGARPVQFGQSNLCSFSYYGACTPGTIYLTDGVSAAAMVRCSGAGGRIRIRFYGLSGKTWSN